MASTENDFLQATLARGATELLTAVPFLRRTILWLALLPEGVRNELLRRELVSFKARRPTTMHHQGTTIP